MGQRLVHFFERENALCDNIHIKYTIAGEMKQAGVFSLLPAGKRKQNNGMARKL